MVRLLLENGANVEAELQDGRTSTHSRLEWTRGYSAVATPDGGLH